MTHFPVAIVGTGFAGIAMSVALQRDGVEHVLLERAADVGGTWRDNRYPGCRCDVPSHLYSFSFDPNPDWPETYSAQPEIWAYLRRAAEKFGVLPRVRFNSEVKAARWDAAARHWEIETASGHLSADVVVGGNGGLSEPATPAIPGLESFSGELFHSATWTDGADLGGKRVAVIGTGASAVQIVPEIQSVVASLHLFQRTPAWVLPHPEHEISSRRRRLYRLFPPAQRAARWGSYWLRELLVLGLAKNPAWVAPIRRLATQHLERQVKDPALRAKLMPRFSPGCKRLLMSNDFYRALTKPNVEVVTDGIEAVTPAGVVKAGGREHPVDVIISATGFRVTDNPFAERIHDAGGRTLAEVWREHGQQAYRGVAVHGFPNLFLLLGPNTGLGHTSVVFMIEAQVGYIRAALRRMRRRRGRVLEVRCDAQARFNSELQRKLAGSVWNTGGCASWYLDSRGKNTTMWPDFTWRYALQMKRFDASAYEMDSPRLPVPEKHEAVHAHEPQHQA